MHQLIYGLVYDESHADGLERAKYDVFQPLVEEHVFDYYVTFEEDGHGVAGRDRWGELPAVVEADTQRGQQLINRGWDATVEEYWRGFKRVEEFIHEHEPSEFWRDPDLYAQYQLDFQRIGEHHGPGTFLYDQDGEGIRHESHLESVQNYWREEYADELYENQDLYVVPADVHY